MKNEIKRQLDQGSTTVVLLGDETDGVVATLRETGDEHLFCSTADRYCAIAAYDHDAGQVYWDSDVFLGLHPTFMFFGVGAEILRAIANFIEALEEAALG